MSYPLRRVKSPALLNPNMTDTTQNLIWIDLEMTGLDCQKDRILEIATLITDKNLNILAEGPVLAIHQNETILSGLDDWNRKHHGESGLLERVRASSVHEEEAEASTLAFLKAWVPTGLSPMCGNSVCQDRRFLSRCMPKLEAYFHYRNLDVSTIKELATRWAPQVKDAFKKKNSHQALDDIRESVAELHHYRAHFFRF